MRYAILFSLLFLQLSVQCQIKGNQQIVTRHYSTENLRSLEMNLYADVTVDCTAEAKMSITADENLIDLIETQIEDGHLKLTQKEWIKASQNIVIQIGAPQLERIEHSVHETTWVKNINRSSFQARAIIGKLVLEGKVDQLSAGAEIGAIDANDLEAKDVRVNLWSHGKIELAAPASINGMVKEDGQVIYQGTQTKVKVKTKNGGLAWIINSTSIFCFQK